MLQLIMYLFPQKNKILFKLQSSGESTHMVNVPLSVNEISEYVSIFLFNIYI